MSYSTFIITDNKISFDNKPMRTAHYAKQKLLDQADRAADDYVASGGDCDYNGDYHAQADAEAMMLDDDIYFAD